MEIASLGYRTDVMIRRLEGAETLARDGWLVIRSPANPAFWWGNFVLIARPPRPGELAVWLARFAAEFPGAGHVAFGLDERDVAALELPEFLAAGFTLDAQVVLTAAALRGPAHVSRAAVIRPLAGEDDWRQSAELRVACHGEAGEGMRDFLRRRAAGARAVAGSGAGEWLGAFLGDRLVGQLGMVWGAGDVARYQDVETHPGARRQGLAGTLLHRAGMRALARGARCLVIVADPAGDAVRLYRSLGFSDTEYQAGLIRGAAGT